VTNREYALGELASRLSARLVGGDPGLRIHGVASLTAAVPGQVSHLSSAAYRSQLPTTAASAVILAEADLPLRQGAALVVERPYLAFARATQLFAHPYELAPAAATSATIDATAEVDPSAVIGAGARVGARTRIGARARLHANAVIGEDCVLDDDVEIMPNAVLYARVRIGARSIVHAGSVIGADGFGFTPDERGWLETIAQLGGVVIGSDVSVGACTTIDRGALEDTVIGDGVKIDNQVQIGHNTRIGDHTLICGCVGIVGSTRIGRHCVLAGGVGIGGDLPVELCDGVVVSAMTHVSASITTPGVYSGGVLHGANRQWKRNALRFQHLDELARRVARLERRFDQSASDEHRDIQREPDPT
jgi:UDP-3-O-[3-hydroxymyristoyl] glucosamine N-acyltransferase